MAYMNKEKRDIIKEALNNVEGIKDIRYTLKISLQSITMTIWRGKYDFAGDAESLGTDLKNFNQFWPQETFDEHLPFVREVLKALNCINYDNSDIQADYFDVGYYAHLKFGNYSKPYELIA